MNNAVSVCINATVLRTALLLKEQLHLYIYIFPHDFRKVHSSGVSVFSKRSSFFFQVNTVKPVNNGTIKDQKDIRLQGGSV